MRAESEVPTGEVFGVMGSFWGELVAVPTGDQVGFVRQNVKPDGLVLDLCCGDGRHSVALCKLGFRMVGLDFSKTLLLLARKKAADAGVDFPVLRADMRFVPFRAGVFSWVISVDSSFGYLRSEEEDLVSFREVRRVLHADGVFLVDVFNRDYFVWKYGGRSGLGLWRIKVGFSRRFPRLARIFGWKEYPSFSLLQKRKVSSSGDELVDWWAVLTKKDRRISIYRHVVRLYSLRLLVRLLETAEFHLQKVHGGYHGENYTPDSKRLIVLAEKCRGV